MLPSGKQSLLNYILKYPGLNWKLIPNDKFSKSIFLYLQITELRLELGATSRFWGPLANYVAFIVYVLILRPKVCD